jgi:hypothetical protein
MNTHDIERITDAIDEALAEVSAQEAFDAYQHIADHCTELHNAIWYNLNARNR